MAPPGVPSLLVLVTLTSLVTPGSSKVRLVNNGYEGVTIAINPDIKENYHILKRLEEFLVVTSQTLFKATRNQLYFREFMIVIPEEWRPMQHYENALDVDLDRAQIIIDRSNPAYGDAPYVKQYAECGSPGLYIHLTPGYLLDDRVVQKWGKPDKTLVHEWAHLRWGLFDEYPIDAQDDAFYRYAGLWQPTRCSTQVEGSILNEYTSRPCAFDFFTGKPEKNCRFFPRMAANKAAASLMFMQYLNSILEFCDNSRSAPKHIRHNFLAPNRHNRLCMYKSAWEVMRKHKDFAKAKKPLPDNTNTRPRFRYVQAHPRKRVLVLDTSGSMTGQSLSVMKQAASNYILSCIESGSKMGIVQFSTNATALSDLTNIASENDRFKLIDSLPMRADGKTSIGAGLKKGVEVLTQEGGAPGGSIILITDGKENEGPYLKDLRPALMKRGIVVHALAYGQKAETSIAALSQDTGGKTFFYSGKSTSTALIDGLAATVASEARVIPKPSIPQSILTAAGLVKRGQPVTGSFFIDSTIGHDTSLTFSYQADVDVTVIGPDVVYTDDGTSTIFRADKPSKVLKVLLPGLAAVGTWTYRISTSKAQTSYTVSVQSKVREKGGDVLQVTSWIPDQGDVTFDPKNKFGIYAEVMRGKAPVFGARVMATIERPGGPDIDIMLYDNGVGADIIKDDGVYAATVMATDFAGNGRYNIKVKVVGKEGETKVVVGGAGRSSGALEMKSAGQMLRTETSRIESFQRVASAGEFSVKGYAEHTMDAMSTGGFGRGSGGDTMAGPGMEDEIAPSRITDLRITNFDFVTNLATLMWTSVGDDLERGKATKYIIYTSLDFEKLLFELNTTTSIPHHKVINGSLVKPRLSGFPETFTVHLDELLSGDNTTIYLGVVALDEAGNAAECSNIVPLSVASDTSVPRVATPTVGLGTYLAIALPAALALFVFSAIAVGMLIVRAKKMKSKDLDSVSNYGYKSDSLNSLDVNYFNSNMNYMFDGAYRKRLQENPDTWSKASL